MWKWSWSGNVFRFPAYFWNFVQMKDLYKYLGVEGGHLSSILNEPQQVLFLTFEKGPFPDVYCDDKYCIHTWFAFMYLFCYALLFNGSTVEAK